jgi:hypothetical protein
MIEQSIEILEKLDKSECKTPLVAALATQALSKPQDHKGDGRLDMYRLSCAVPLRRKIAGIMQLAKEAHLTTEATRDRGLGGFEEAWREYSSFPE